jgi:GT2 family glycosyltransferase
MLVRRDVFETLGGFDERLRIGGNDVDLCIRIRKAGYQVVYNPHAILYHHEGLTRKGSFPLSDADYFARKLKEEIRKGDPYYNRNLSTGSGECYSIDPGLVGL